MSRWIAKHPWHPHLWYIVMKPMRYKMTLEILASAWEAGRHGGDTSTLDRTYRLLGVIQ